MAANEIHINDVGTKFLVTVTDGASAVNISSAGTKQLIFKKPSGTKLTKAAVFNTDGTDGKMYYNAIADDLDETGLEKDGDPGNQFISFVYMYRITDPGTQAPIEIGIQVTMSLPSYLEDEMELELSSIIGNSSDGETLENPDEDPEEPLQGGA